MLETRRIDSLVNNLRRTGTIQLDEGGGIFKILRIDGEARSTRQDRFIQDSTAAEISPSKSFVLSHYKDCCCKKKCVCPLLSHLSPPAETGSITYHNRVLWARKSALSLSRQLTSLVSRSS